MYRPTTIVDDIWQGIRDAKLLVAELTDRNPNVFYELGLAHAISKPVILISKSIDDVPFDLRSIRVLVYDKDHPDWGSRLRESLVKAVGEVQRSPTSAIPTTFKQAVRRDVPEESETLMRLEALESMVHRLSDSLDSNDSYSPINSDESLLKHRPLPEMHAGSYVFHKKFGQGKVLSLDGSGRDLRAQINFEKAGVKWLALAVAHLEILPY